MGNSSTKEESRNSVAPQPQGSSASSASSPYSHGHRERHSISHPARSGRRHDVSFFGLGGQEFPSPEVRRETKQERDARRAERDRVARLKERERSMQEEGVDGGYLVTLGTYTGTEDFSKPIVRQLMIERRIAPFWRGLNDHSESWTEHQLVAAARGLRIPAPDEIPSDDILASTTASESPSSASKPIPVRSPASPSFSYEYASTFFAASNPYPSHNEPAFASSSPSGAPPLFRARSKTLASLSSKPSPLPDPTPPEIKLPHQPQINGQPVEAYLYKDVGECPICFLYYPPYLNRTRCCDQPICSECFVQIKRPDPHPPEHLDPNTAPPEDIRRQEEEGVLVTEPATCPFCVQSDFGVTYESPPFRRGLAYPSNHPSATSSASPSKFSADNPSSRKRGVSVSASDSSVITTDRVRPDWAKKLADARAQQARRSAAATALHNAAYIMNNTMPDSRVPFRRRRYLVNPDGFGSSEDNTPRHADGTPVPNMEALMAALEGQSSSHRRSDSGTQDSHHARMGSRGSRTEDLEEMMVMEAIRQSLAAEEERKKKEEKEAAKEAKKEEKRKAKEQKKVDKATRKGSLYPTSANSSSNFFSSSPSGNETRASPEGKGKAKASPNEDAPSLNSLGFSILNEPTSTINTERPAKQTTSPEPNLSNSELNASLPAASMPLPSSGLSRQLSASSSSDFPPINSDPTSPTDDPVAAPTASASRQPPASSTADTEPTLDFDSVAAMVDSENDKSSAAAQATDEIVSQPPAAAVAAPPSPSDLQDQPPSSS